MVCSTEGVGNLLNLWATFSPNNVSADRHHSSGLKEKGLSQKFRPFFRQIDSEDQKKKIFARNSGPFSDKSVMKTTKKIFHQGIRIILAVYCCISLKKEKKVAGRVKCLGGGP